MCPRSHRRGSTAIEFSLTLSLLAITAIVVGELGSYLSERQRFVQATFEAARYASSITEPTEPQVVQHAQQVLTEMGLGAQGMDLDLVHWVDGEDQVVTVTLTLPVRVAMDTLEVPATHTQQFTLVQQGT